MRDVSLQTADGATLSAKLFLPDQPNNKLLIVNSATGVRQQLYFALATYLNGFGVSVITYDYRGIGESKPQNLKGFSASMRVWGTEDFPAVCRYAAAHFPGYEMFLLGHSVGALIVGMDEHAAVFKKYIFLATQDAYYRHLPLKIALTALLGFGVALPLLTKMMGYFPSQFFGLGEPLPTGVAMDWRTLILHPKSTSRLYEKISTDYSKSMTQETVILFAEDDPWVKRKGMESLMTRVYANLKTKFVEIPTAESPEKHIGHVSFFRSYNGPLWGYIARELQEDGTKMTLKQ